MEFNAETMSEKYLQLRDEQDRINKAAKTKVAELEKVKVDIENWFLAKSDEEGLVNFKTKFGNAHWTTVYSATCAEPATFKQHVIDNQQWDLLETRPSKTAVKSYVEAHGAPPPGVNFASIKNFVLTRASVKE